MVSAMLSPFLIEETSPEWNPITFPPNLYIADSKLRRVLVDGSKNKVAKIFPLNR